MNEDQKRPSTILVLIVVLAFSWVGCHPVANTKADQTLTIKRFAQRLASFQPTACLKRLHKPAAICRKLSAQSLLGQWLIEDGSYQIAIEKSSSGLLARIVKVKEGLPMKDIHNQASGLRRRSLVGLIITSNISYDLDNRSWFAKDVYIPQRGEYYDCGLRLEKANLIEATYETWGGMLSISRQLTKLP